MSTTNRNALCLYFFKNKYYKISCLDRLKGIKFDVIYIIHNMNPLFFKLKDHLPLMVIPDTQAHLDGHAIITLTYSIFFDADDADPAFIESKENNLHLENNNDPDYYGNLTFEKPGQLFTYTSGRQRNLSSEQVNELIEHLSHIRDNPANWKNFN